MRIFEVVSKYQNKNINIPYRATKGSAGYDLEAAERVVIRPNETKLVPVGLKACFSEDEVLLIFCRSSIALKRNLALPNGVGVIDSDYYNNEDNEGEIFVQLRNFGEIEQVIEKKERIAQGIFIKYLSTDNDQKSDIIRSGGFGSSGK